jgi:hypothetical protein
MPRLLRARWLIDPLPGTSARAARGKIAALSGKIARRFHDRIEWFF